MNRRSLILGAIGLVAAPSIVRAASLMPISTKAIEPPIYDAFTRLYNEAVRIVDAHAHMRVDRDFVSDVFSGRGYLRFIHRTQGGAIAEMKLEMTADQAVNFGIERSSQFLWRAVRNGMVVKTMDLLEAGFILRPRPRTYDEPILMGFAAPGIIPTSDAAPLPLARHGA